MGQKVKIFGELQAVTGDGVIADAKQVKNGYVVVKTITERNALSAAVLAEGMPVYVSDEKKTYRWNGNNGWDVEKVNAEVDLTEIEADITALQTKVNGMKEVGLNYDEDTETIEVGGVEGGESEMLNTLFDKYGELERHASTTAQRIMDIEDEMVDHTERLSTLEVREVDFYRGLIRVTANIGAVKKVIAQFQMDGLFEMPNSEFTASVFYDLLKANSVHFLSGYVAEQNLSSEKWTCTPLVAVWVANENWGQDAYVYFGYAGETAESGSSAYSFPPYASCHVGSLSVSILQAGDHTGQ